MTIDNKIRDEKLQYDINREKRVIEQAKFTDTPSGKVFEKQTKTI